MYSQAYGRAWFSLSTAWSSVAARDRAYWKGTCGKRVVRQEGMRPRSQWRAHWCQNAQGLMQRWSRQGAPRTDWWADRKRWTDRGENLERRHSDCGFGRFGKLDASKIYPRRINAKEVLISQKGDEFILPVADGTAKLSWRDYEFRESTLRREQTVRSEDFSRELQGEPGDYQPTESTDDAEARADFWSIQGDFIYRHQNEHRVLPLKYIDVTRATYTDLDVVQETRSGDYWNVDSIRSLSDSGKGFTQFKLLKGKPPKGHMWPGEETDKSSNDYQTRSCMARSIDPNRESRSQSRKTRTERREAQTRQCSTTERNWLCWSLKTKIKQKLSKMRGEKRQNSWQQPCGAKEKIRLATWKWLRRYLHPRRFQKRLVVV